MKKSTGIHFTKNHSGLRSDFILIIILAFCLSSCTRKPEPYTILKLYGEAEVGNISMNLYMTKLVADTVHPDAMIVKKGDILFFNDIFYQYSDPVKDSIYIKTTLDKCFINGKLASLRIASKDTAAKTLKEVIKMDVAELSMIFFDSYVPEISLPLLKEIAKINPRISLGFDNMTGNLEALLQIFNPKLLIIPYISDHVLEVIAKSSKPEVLMINAEDSVLSGPLPFIPSLKQLIVFGMDDKVPGNFLAANPQIERINIMASKFFDFRKIEPLRNLKDLIITQADSVANQEILGNKNSIEILAVFSEYFKYDSTLDNLHNLRWIKFTPEIKQTDFDRFISKHPELEVVELTDCKNLEIGNSLLSLNKLYGLTLYNHSKDSSSITELKNLKYLSLPNEDIRDSLRFAGLKRSLPNTIIVANDGACLGSGWLLLLFPLVFVFRLVCLKIPRSSGKTD